MTPSYVEKSIGCINHFASEADANTFAAQAKIRILLTLNVQVVQDEHTGNWHVAQSLEYLTTEGESSYAMSQLPKSRQ